MLLATATTPGTPMLIIAGVSTNAPPEPMKPLTMPPTKPTRKSTTTEVAFSSMKEMLSMGGFRYFFLARRPSRSQKWPVKAPCTSENTMAITSGTRA